MSRPDTIDGSQMDARAALVEGNLVQAIQRPERVFKKDSTDDVVRGRRLTTLWTSGAGLRSLRSE